MGIDPLLPVAMTPPLAAMPRLRSFTRCSRTGAFGQLETFSSDAKVSRKLSSEGGHEAALEGVS